MTAKSECNDALHGGDTPLSDSLIAFIAAAQDRGACEYCITSLLVRAAIVLADKSGARPQDFFRLVARVMDAEGIAKVDVKDNLGPTHAASVTLN